MGSNAVAFIRALGLKTVDLLGFSIGGYISQAITLKAPDLVRRLVLVGTGPRGGDHIATITPEMAKVYSVEYEETDQIWVYGFFTASETSRAAGWDFLKRIRQRNVDRDPDVSKKVAPAQIEAMAKWGAPIESFDYLKAIKQPTLVVHGGNDVIVYTANSIILQKNLPNAQLILYPDSNHGALYQYHDLFVNHVSTFLSGENAWAA
jgi:pimeloyl-ACP methyl ester carboxylesterase